MAITTTELEKYYLDEMLEQQGYKSQTDFYTKLLTEGAKTAQESAKAYYDPIAEQAGKQASYDISGAYASYLKQQQNIAAQSGLESGYKEEVGSGLKSAYGSAYQQAKATEAQTLASAAEKASSIYSSGVESAQKTITSQLEAMATEASQRAKLFKATEKYATQGLTGDLYRPYATYEDDVRVGEGIYQYNDATGEYEITDLGRDLYAKSMLSDADAYKSYLEEQGLLDYYLTNQGALTKDLFGVESVITDAETGKTRLATYDPTSEASMKARYSTEGYLEEQIKQNRPKSLGLVVLDQNVLVSSEKQKEILDYIKALGLTEQEVADFYGVNSISDYMTSITTDAKKKTQTAMRLNEQYNQFLNDLETIAKKKYRG